MFINTKISIYILTSIFLFIFRDQLFYANRFDLLRNKFVVQNLLTEFINFYDH